METIVNPWLELTFNPIDLSFSLKSLDRSNLEIRHARLDVLIASKKGINLQLLPTTLLIEQASPSPHGPLTKLSALYLDRSNQLQVKVEFALPANKPFLMQRISLQNKATSMIRPEKFVFAGIKKDELTFSEKNPSRTAFFSNGWQSWSPTGVWQYGEKQNRSRLIGLSTPMLYNTGTPVTRQTSHFSSDMFAALLDHDAQAGLIVGFLSQKEQFGSIETKLHPQPELKVWANCDQIELMPGATLRSDWLAWEFFDPFLEHPFETYLKAVAVENAIKDTIPTPTGWCSWYYYFQKITPEVLKKNLEVVEKVRQTLPLDFFQIDDGFEQDVGTWLQFQPFFPEGIAPLSTEIRAKGMTPGIWLAPFILESKSEIIKKHPDWLLRKANGRAVNSGFVWDWLGKALDLTHPEVQAYVRKVIRTVVHEWGIPYLKLDFLYAAALPGKHHDPSLTRAQILRQAIELIRVEAGEDCILLGCGVPLGSGLGIFDLMRISADVSPAWEPEFAGLKAIFRDEPNMPCARNAILNILTRANLDPHWWVNDPDCLLVRDDSKLTLAEVQSLATAISITGGAYLISDDMSRLNPERLRLAASLLPVLPSNPRVVDLFERNMPTKVVQKLHNTQSEWHLIALFNWEDRPQNLEVSLEEFGLYGECYLIREFWTGDFLQVENNFAFAAVPAHGVRLFAVREKEPLVYLGSDLHLSQGIELTDWQLMDQRLLMKLDLAGRHASGKVFLWSECGIESVKQGDHELQWRKLEQYVYELPVNLSPTAVVEVLLKKV